MNYIKHSFKGKEYRSHPHDDADFGVWSHVAFPSDGSKILKLPPRHLATAPSARHRTRRCGHACRRIGGLADMQ